MTDDIPPSVTPDEERGGMTPVVYTFGAFVVTLVLFGIAWIVYKSL